MASVLRCTLQVLAQDSTFTYRVLVTPFNSGQQELQKIAEGVSAQLGSTSSLQLKSEYSGPAVQVYSASSVSKLDSRDLCAAMTVVAGKRHCTSSCAAVYLLQRYCATLSSSLFKLYTGPAASSLHQHDGYRFLQTIVTERQHRFIRVGGCMCHMCTAVEVLFYLVCRSHLLRS